MVSGISVTYDRACIMQNNCMTFKTINHILTSDQPLQSFSQIRFLLIVKSLIEAKLSLQKIYLMNNKKRNIKQFTNNIS